MRIVSSFESSLQKRVNNAVPNVVAQLVYLLKNCLHISGVSSVPRPVPFPALFLTRWHPLPLLPIERRVIGERKYTWKTALVFTVALPTRSGARSEGSAALRMLLPVSERKAVAGGSAVGKVQRRGRAHCRYVRLP